MADVETALSSITSIGSNATPTLQCLALKQDLLIRLLEHEQTRLQVWLFPTQHDRKHRFAHNRAEKPLGVRYSSRDIDSIMFPNKRSKSHHSFSKYLGLRILVLQSKLHIAHNPQHYWRRFAVFF